MKKNTSFLSKAALTLALIVICAMTWAETVQTYYIDENGTRHDVTATVLTGTGNLTGDQWYVVNSDVTIENTSERIFCSSQSSGGNINLILSDGKTFTITSSNTLGIICSGGFLSIYGQENGTGTLNVTANGSSGNAIYAEDGVNIVGCKVSVASNGGDGIMARGSITISGGQITAIDCRDEGIRTNSGFITLGWTNTSDFIRAKYYISYDGVCVAVGQKLTDGTTTYSGTLNRSQISAIAGKTLTPVISSDFVPKGNTYTIYTDSGWGMFCDLLESGESFSGKTVKLGADITVTRMAGSGSGSDLTANDHPFCGTFDGCGNTLTFNYGSSGTPADENNLAPFRYVNNATIRRLHVSGNIYTQHVHAGGIIGMAYGTTNVTDCRSSVNIISSINGDGTHGGIMSCSWTGSTTNITGCLFDGSIQSASGYATDQCGGFVGWRNATINVTDCLLTADLSTICDSEGLLYPSGTFVRNGNPSTITNSYYDTALGTAQGKQRRSITAGENVTVAYAGTATVYATSGITSYGTGIKYDNVLYAGSDDAVSLTLGNTPPTGYGFSGYTASAGTLTGTANPYTLTMPDADVTIGATFDPLPVSVKYIDANGVEQTVTALPLAGGAATHLSAGWYVVNSNITYTGTVYLDGNVNLILVDDAVMNVTNARFGIMGNDKGISFSVYGQGGQSGELNVSNSSYAIFGQGDILIAGGNVTVVGCKFGIHAENGGNVTIKNATVTASMANDENDGKCISSYGGVVTIDNSNVTAIGKGNLGIGIYTENGNIVIRNGGKTTAKAAYPSTIYAGNGDITITDCEVEVTGACGLFAENWNKDGVDITIQNAKVTASDSYYAIYSKNGDVTIEGGQVSATGAVKGIMVEGSGNIVLGWTNATDYIYANSYSVASGTVSIAGSKVMSNGTEELTGTISDLTKVDGKTLRPYNPAIALASATIIGESKYVGTFFSSAQDFQLPEGARAYTASLDGTKVVFHQIGDDGRVIPHGTAAIVVADAANITLTTTSTTVSAYAGNILQGSDTALAKPAGTVYVLGVDNGGVPGFYTFTGSTIPAGKAYYVVD